MEENASLTNIQIPTHMKLFRSVCVCYLNKTVNVWAQGNVGDDDVKEFES